MTRPDAAHRACAPDGGVPRRFPMRTRTTDHPTALSVAVHVQFPAGRGTAAGYWECPHVIPAEEVSERAATLGGRSSGDHKTGLISPTMNVKSMTSTPAVI